MTLQQTIEDQQEKVEQILKECAVARQPPLTIATIAWTALRNLDGYEIEITMKGKETLAPHRFSLPDFDLKQNGPYLRDILKGWLSEIEKNSSG